MIAFDGLCLYVYVPEHTHMYRYLCVYTDMYTYAIYIQHAYIYNCHYRADTSTYKGVVQFTDPRGRGIESCCAPLAAGQGGSRTGLGDNLHPETFPRKLSPSKSKWDVVMTLSNGKEGQQDALPIFLTVVRHTYLAWR